MRDAQVAAVAADFDRRSPSWEWVYEGVSYHDHVLRDRKTLALDFVGPLDPGRVLDVGCGAGQLLEALAKEQWHPTGCDVAFRQAVASRRRLQSARVAQGDGGHLPFPDATFDLVTALGYLEYTPDPGLAIAELVRVTAPGGHLVVSGPNRFRIAYLLDPLGVVRGKLFPVHRGYRRRYFTVRSLRRLLRQAGASTVAARGHAIGRIALAGIPLWSDRRAIVADRWLSARLPLSVLNLAGADLVVFGCRD
jgi:ubiquinone/menaquinone biosynthesis C-methylase UbiE